MLGIWFLVYVIVVFLIAGIVVWAVDQFPLDATIKRMIRVFIIAFLLIWLLLTLVGFLPVPARIR